MRITVLPAESGRPVTKSNAMWDHGRNGMERSLRRPAGGVLLDLVWEQSWHEAIKCRTSRSLVGHQKLWLIPANVPLTPGCAINLDEWAQQRTAGRTTSGTNIVPSGAWAGLVTWKSALLTAGSTPQMAAPTTQCWDEILSVVEGPLDEQNWREREKFKTVEKKSPTSLTGIKYLSGTDMLQILMIVQTMNPSSQCRHSPRARRIAKSSRLQTSKLRSADERRWE